MLQPVSDPFHLGRSMVVTEPNFHVFHMQLLQRFM